MQSIFRALVVAFAFAPSVHAATTYSLTDLGDLPGGGDFSEALDLNASGAVVGTSFATNMRLGFFWQNGVMTSVGDLPGGSSESWAVGVNASGQVVGYSDATAGRRPFLWQNGVMLDLSMQPGSASFVEAADINDAGQVVGRGSGPTGNRAVLWENGENLVDLGVYVPPNTFSLATAINASGFVVGWGAAGLGDSIRALSWSTPGVPVDRGELSGGRDRSIAFDVNASGQMAGRSETAAGDRAAWWDGGGPIELPPLAGFDEASEALGINALGEIVGSSESEEASRGVLWDASGGPYDLNDRLDESGDGYVILSANAINDAGQIAADAEIDGATHAVLLTPVPEPGALAAAIASLGALLTARRATRH